jgi:PBSX family phage portal protein
MSNEQELKLHEPQRVNKEGALPVIKTHFVDFGFNETQSVREDPELAQMFANSKALEPPYDPTTLFGLYDMSGSLRTNVDIYEQNVDGGDYALVPVIDLNQSDVKTQVANALVAKKLRERLRTESLDALVARMTKVSKTLRTRAPSIVPDTGEGDTDLDEALALSAEFGVTETDIQAAIDTIRQVMVVEEANIQLFLRYCSLTDSFKSLRKQKTRDMEVTGNAYWEILRTEGGIPSEIRYVQAQTIRLCAMTKGLVDVTQVMRIDPLNSVTVTRSRPFRTFVRILGGTKAYFKEFGDPRVVSSVTGKVYETKESLYAVEKDNIDKNPSLEATELYHFSVKSAMSPYGVPRWISELLAVLGNRYAEEINLAFFENKSIPPMAILVSGGRLAKGDVDRLRDFIKNEIRGKRNFHKILILEAESSNPMGITNGKVTIEIKPLQHYIPDDGQFMKYMERNDDGIGSVFRNPRIARANTHDFNRATADAAMQVADNQVYGPLREDFDWFMNDVLFEAMGVRFYRFLTLAPKNTNKDELAKFIDQAAARGFLSIPELRRLSEGVFQTTFQRPDTDQNLDIPLEILRMQSRNSANPPTADGGGDGGDAAQNEGVIPPSKSPQGPGATPDSAEMMDVNKEAFAKFMDLLGTVESDSRVRARKLAAGVFAARKESTDEPEL